MKRPCLSLRKSRSHIYPGIFSIYLLIPLKRTLRRLSLATNPDVTSESASAMLLLVNLEFLSILDTGVDMAGLRILAGTIFEESRNIDIEIPYACETYIDSKYYIHSINLDHDY